MVVLAIGAAARELDPGQSEKLQAKRLVRKLKAIREDMLDRMHNAVRERSPMSTLRLAI
jgi:hypothetical protein